MMDYTLMQIWGFYSAAEAARRAALLDMALAHRAASASDDDFTAFRKSLEP